MQIRGALDVSAASPVFRAGATSDTAAKDKSHGSPRQSLRSLTRHTNTTVLQVAADHGKASHNTIRGCMVSRTADTHDVRVAGEQARANPLPCRWRALCGTTY